MDGCPGRRAVGLLELLLHHHCSRAHLETTHAQLHSSHHCGTGALSPGALSGRNHLHSPLYRHADPVEPRADVLLLPLCHRLHAPGMAHRGIPQEDAAPMDGRHGSLCRRRSDWRVHQPEQPISHMGIQSGEHAWQERADAEDQGSGRPDQQRTGTLVHHSVELRKR